MDFICDLEPFSEIRSHLMQHSLSMFSLIDFSTLYSLEILKTPWDAVQLSEVVLILYYYVAIV